MSTEAAEEAEAEADADPATASSKAQARGLLGKTWDKTVENVRKKMWFWMISYDVWWFSLKKHDQTSVISWWLNLQIGGM